MRTKVILSLFVSSSILAACGSDAKNKGNGQDPTDAMMEDTTGDGSASGNGPGANDTGSGGGSGTEGPSEEGTTGTDNPFLITPDGGTAVKECDVWTQDCPEGEKCMPWANDGGSSWNATKCTTLAATPASPGDECMVEGSGVSGVDNCAASSMCWNSNEQGVGTCVEFCQGSEAAPTCTNADDVCSVTNEGVLILCLAKCNPLMPTCNTDLGEACYPVRDLFTCSVDASGPDEGVAGDPCAYLNVCDPGLFCANPAAVPDCESTDGCCNPFCDLTAENPAADCLTDQECVPWYEEGDQTAPPDLLGVVGACAVP